ncbi:MAG: P-loop NTPase [Oscillospiraceae bacterium]|nr:P-loop NTPase [Oscillospiraceae bacterium]
MSDCSNNCSSCGESCGERREPQDFHEPCHELSHIKHVVAVMSGKGGVGKSLVTASLAASLQRKGYSVGILDADITGPSIPKAFGIHEKATGSELGIYPVSTRTGIQIMSLNLLTARETDPVIWRGPVIAGTVKQFWTDVIWGDVDYLFVDMPPGTGDVPLTVFQTLPVDGIVVVTSPQDLVSMIVTKAVKMAQMMNIPILGLVENYSYFKCPDCGGMHRIFGESHLEETARENGVAVLDRIPMDPVLAAACDGGKIEDFTGNYLDHTAGIIEGQLKGAEELLIAVTTQGGQIFQHFGHSEEFTLYTIRNGEIAEKRTLGTNGTGHSALAVLLSEQRVNALICGGIGGGAINALGERGILVLPGAQGDADAAVTQYITTGEVGDPNARCDHHDHGEGHACGEHDHSCGGHCHG